MGIILPRGMQFKIRRDPPLLIHVRVIGVDGKSASTTVSKESEVNPAAEKLTKILLCLPLNPSLRTGINKWSKSSDKEKKREQRRLRRLRRKGVLK